MSEQGNIRLKGGFRITGLGAEVAGSNNGMFTQAIRVGIGHYEYYVDPEWSIAPGDVIKVQPDGEEEGIGYASAVERISEVRFDVRFSSLEAEPGPIDVGHSVRVTEINKG